MIALLVVFTLSFFLKHKSVYTLTDPQKDSHGNPQTIATNVGYFSNDIQSTINISSNSLFQPSSLPSTTSPIHHIPQLLLSKISMHFKNLHIDRSPIF
jgi:hypothetical protein